MSATIASITYTPTHITEKSADKYDRVPFETAELVAGKGIAGDRKGKRNPERQINIMSRETLDQLTREGFQTAPGQMGEQIIVSGLDIDALKAGDRVQFGESAIIEIIKPRTGCEKFKLVQSKEPAEAANRLGKLVRVITGGSIAVGSPVRLVVPESV